MSNRRSIPVAGGSTISSCDTKDENKLSPGRRVPATSLQRASLSTARNSSSSYLTPTTSVHCARMRWWLVICQAADKPPFRALGSAGCQPAPFGSLPDGSPRVQDQLFGNVETLLARSQKSPRSFKWTPTVVRPAGCRTGQAGSLRSPELRSIPTTET
jgi:hypothetical protein